MIVADTDGGEAVGGANRGITTQDLRARWNEAVRELATRGIAVTNPDNALEGALSIRYKKPMQAGTTAFAPPTPLFDMLGSRRQCAKFTTALLTLFATALPSKVPLPALRAPHLYFEVFIFSHSREHFRSPFPARTAPRALRSCLRRHRECREFDGSLVRNEVYVFLDVVWLARVLKPLLNHKDEESHNGSVKLGDTGDTCITLHDSLDIASWGRLKGEGILEPRLAQAMWPAGLSGYALPTLLSLVLAFLLGSDPTGELVVLLRLKTGRPARGGQVMDTFR